MNLLRKSNTNCSHRLVSWKSEFPIEKQKSSVIFALPSTVMHSSCPHKLSMNSQTKPFELQTHSRKCFRNANVGGCGLNGSLCTFRSSFKHMNTRTHRTSIDLIGHSDTVPPIFVMKVWLLGLNVMQQYHTHSIECHAKYVRCACSK